MQRKQAFYDGLLGLRQGSLLIIRIDHTETRRGKIWECICDCGRTEFLSTSQISSAKRSSCTVCAREKCKDRTVKQLTKHGLYGTRLHKIWWGIISRCTYPGDTNFRFYGGRGITVCEEWRSGFTHFMEWALSNGYSDDLSIDRIDPDGGYSPSNCRWATMLEQANNKRNSKMVTVNGETHTAAQWCRVLGVRKTAIYDAWKRRGIAPEDYVKERLSSVQSVEVYR